MSGPQAISRAQISEAMAAQFSADVTERRHDWVRSNSVVGDKDALSVW